jgi:hypothetical protein
LLTGRIRTSPVEACGRPCRYARQAIMQLSSSHSRTPAGRQAPEVREGECCVLAGAVPASARAAGRPHMDAQANLYRYLAWGRHTAADRASSSLRGRCGRLVGRCGRVWRAADEALEQRGCTPAQTLRPEHAPATRFVSGRTRLTIRRRDHVHGGRTDLSAAWRSAAGLGVCGGHSGPGCASPRSEHPGQRWPASRDDPDRS